MSTEQGQDGRAPGSVPNAFGNALAWRWTRQMPTAVRRSGLPTLLYALRAMANAAGELRFNGDRKPIRIQDIAKAACANEKDTRRYLRAAIAAGVVVVKGEQKRGKASLYVLAMTPFPDWAAAEDSLKASRRKPGTGAAPWQETEESSGDRDPNQFGPPRPELETEETEEVRVTATPWGSGHRDPIGSGDRDPNNPGIAKEVPHDPGEVVAQPHVDQAAPRENDLPSQGQDDHDTPPAPVADFTRCTACGDRMVPRPGRTTHTHCTPTAERRAS